MGWELQKTLSEGGVNDKFGFAVGIYGNYAIVGDENAETVYWYQRKNDGTWVETHQVTEPNGDNFGNGVGIYGNYAIVSDTETGARTVYWYQRKTTELGKRHTESLEELVSGQVSVFTETMRL